MTESAPAPESAEAAAPEPVTTDGPSGEGGRTGRPGWLVVSLATLIVVGVAFAEALSQDRIGLWTGIALVAVACVAPLMTRAGDRSLPAMMPPLAFLAATLCAGQLLLDDSGSWRTRQAVMIVETLGSNAPWVLAATALSVTVATIGHLVDRRRR